MHEGFWWGTAGYRAAKEYLEHGILPFAGGALDQPEQFWWQVDHLNLMRYALTVDLLPEVKAKAEADIEAARAGKH